MSGSSPRPRRRADLSHGRGGGRPVQVAGIVARMYSRTARSGSSTRGRRAGLEQPASSSLDEFQVWLIEQRSAGGQELVFRSSTASAPGSTISSPGSRTLLLWLTWIGTTAVGTLLVWRFGGTRAAAITLAAFATYALTGLWEESMQTLALMLVAVALSLLVGIPLGIVAGRSRRVAGASPGPRRAADRPGVRVPDAGRDPLLGGSRRRRRRDDDLRDPAAVRITRSGSAVAVNTVEAAVSMGATPSSCSTRCSSRSRADDPAGRQPGDPVRALDGRHRRPDRRRRARRGRHGGLYSTPALALLAGLVIVVMAISLDRCRGDRRPDRSCAPASRRRWKRRRLRTLGVGRADGRDRRREAVAGAGVYPDTAGGQPPHRTLEEAAGVVQVVLDYVQDPTSWVFGVTELIGVFILQELLLPLRSSSSSALVHDRRRADRDRVRRAASGPLTLAMLGLIGFTGVWAPRWTPCPGARRHRDRRRDRSRARRAGRREQPLSKAMRPVNDVLQTLPQLVYIIPFIYLMPVSIVPGIVAGVLYAFPVVRLVERGIRDVAPRRSRPPAPSVPRGCRC